MSRNITIALTISVILNVLFAGMLLGDVSQNLVVQPAFNTEAELAKLPQVKRTLYNSIMGPAKQKVDAERALIDEAKAQALKLLKAQPFNETAYKAQVQHINDLYSEMKNGMTVTVVTLAGQFSPDERAVLAEIISHPPFAPQHCLPKTDK